MLLSNNEIRPPRLVLPLHGSARNPPVPVPVPLPSAVVRIGQKCASVRHGCWQDAFPEPTPAEWGYRATYTRERP